jgi:hypothetical protein
MRWVLILLAALWVKNAWAQAAERPQSMLEKMKAMPPVDVSNPASQRRQMLRLKCAAEFDELKLPHSKWPVFYAQCLREADGRP